MSLPIGVQISHFRHNYTSHLYWCNGTFPISNCQIACGRHNITLEYTIHSAVCIPTTSQTPSTQHWNPSSERYNISCLSWANTTLLLFYFVLQCPIIYMCALLWSRRNFTFSSDREGLFIYFMLGYIMNYGLEYSMLCLAWTTGDMNKEGGVCPNVNEKENMLRCFNV